MKKWRVETYTRRTWEIEADFFDVSPLGLFFYRSQPADKAPEVYCGFGADEWARIEVAQ